MSILGNSIVFKIGAKVTPKYRCATSPDPFRTWRSMTQSRMALHMDAHILAEGNLVAHKLLLEWHFTWMDGFQAWVEEVPS